MANTTRKRAPAKKPARKAPVKKVANDEPETKTVMVRPLDQNAFRAAIQLIDSAPITGAQSGTVLMLKRELARVAGIPQQ